MSILDVRDVSYSYPGGAPVLEHVDLSFERGRMYVLLGPSGCGKTTLLSLLGGLDVPQSGQILLEGRDIQAIGLNAYRREHVSFVFQNYNLIDYLTPVENVQLTAREPAMPVLERLGLTREQSTRSVLKLSGGQQQRVAIARALASGSPIVLADEPTGNLDADTVREITTVLQDTAHVHDRCVVVVSHSQEVADAADHVIRMR